LARRLLFLPPAALPIRVKLVVNERCELGHGDGLVVGRCVKRVLGLVLADELLPGVLGPLRPDRHALSTRLDRCGEVKLLTHPREKLLLVLAQLRLR
jgi:hypothetical protein